MLGWAVFLFMVGFIIYKGRSLTAICGRQGSQNHTACDPKQNCFLLQIWKWRAGPAVAAAAEADTVVSDGGGGGNTKLYRTKKNHSHWHFRKVKILVLMFYNEHITNLKLQMLIIFAHCRTWKNNEMKKRENPYNRQLVFCLRETKRRISWHPEQGPWQEIKLPFNTFKTFNGEKGCKLPWVQTEGGARCGEVVMLLNLATRNSNEMSGYDVIGAGPGHNETSGSK